MQEIRGVSLMQIDTLHRHYRLNPAVNADCVQSRALNLRGQPPRARNVINNNDRYIAVGN